MSKLSREPHVGGNTSIWKGWLYFEEAAQAQIDTDLFVELLDDKHTKSIRVESLHANWQERTWISGVGFHEFSLKIDMTLRKEIVKGHSYWYAYRRAGGRLQKRYVGSSDRVTTKRLVEIAGKLA